MAQEIAYPTLSVSEQIERFDELALSAEAHLPATDDPLQRGVVLAEALFQGSHAFLGNGDAYDDPANSFLNDVLDRRLGIPISLSVLFLDAARRLDIDAVGIGMPGHFIVGLRSGRSMWYLDPFHGGGRLSLADCARLVSVTTGYNGPFRSEWLTPTPPRDILGRMLNNLRASYVRLRHWQEVVATVQLLRELYPNDPQHLRDLGLAYFRGQSPRLALHYLDAYLRAEPDSPDADTIREGVRETAERWARWN